MTNAGLTPDGLFDFWTPVGDMIRMPLMMLLAGLKNVEGYDAEFCEAACNVDPIGAAAGCRVRPPGGGLGVVLFRYCHALLPGDRVGKLAGVCGQRSHTKSQSPAAYQVVHDGKLPSPPVHSVYILCSPAWGRPGSA